MNPKTRLTPWANPACKTYFITGLVAAGAMALAISERTFGLFTVVPTLVAVVGLIFGWTNAPVFVLLAVAIALLIAQPVFLPNSHLIDMILAGTVLTYVVAHYRLSTLTTAAFPTDTRKPLTIQNAPSRPTLPAVLEFLMALTVIPYLLYLALRKPNTRSRDAEPERRNAKAVLPDEIARAMIGVFCCSGAALAIWLTTNWQVAPLNAIPHQWQLGLILWIVVLPAILAATVLSYIRWRMIAAVEARLILSDELWKQTRREQRSMARWTVWARKRQEREVRS